MISFSETTKHVPYVDHAALVDDSSQLIGDGAAADKVVVFHLTPVGMDRQPDGPAEFENCIRCLIEILAGCQEAGWINVKWHKVICADAAGKQWYVIDAAEHATRAEQQPMSLGFQLPPGVTQDPLRQQGSEGSIVVKSNEC